MNITGIVVEYNPFHNGHLHHLSQSREVTNADIVIAVMSGNFLQRGEPALLPKHIRAEMAVASGVDLVVELPYYYSTQHADLFGYGSIEILNALRVNAICFGSELGSIAPFQRVAQASLQKEDEFRTLIRDVMKEGKSYAAAQTDVLCRLIKEEAEWLHQPNNVLGLSYIKAIEKINPTIKGFTIQRKAAGYHDTQFATKQIASATSIRLALAEHVGSVHNGVFDVMPESSFAILKRYMDEGGSLRFFESYYPLLRFKILSTPSHLLRQFYEIEEGIENRMRSVAVHAESMQQFLTELKTKRYTWTRLQRMCLHILTGATKEEMNNAMKQPLPFILPLAYNEKGKAYLNEYKKDFLAPLYSPKEAKRDCMYHFQQQLHHVYFSACSSKDEANYMERNWRQIPIFVQQHSESTFI